jgi:hypothetical protein
MRRQWHEPDTSAQVIVGRMEPVIPYSNEIEANSVIERLVWHLLSINRRRERGRSISQRIREEEKADAGHESEKFVGPLWRAARRIKPHVRFAGGQTRLAGI